MDADHHADDEMRVIEPLEKYRERLVAQAKATMLARPGVRIAGLILHESLLETPSTPALPPPTQHPTAPERVGIVPRAFAADFIAQFNSAAADWLPSDERDGDQYQLPVVVAFQEGLQTTVVKFTP